MNLRIWDLLIHCFVEGLNYSSGIFQIKFLIALCVPGVIGCTIFCIAVFIFYIFFGFPCRDWVFCALGTTIIIQKHPNLKLLSTIFMRNWCNLNSMTPVSRKETGNQPFRRSHVYCLLLSQMAFHFLCWCVVWQS